jgi:hypothetical protein
METEAQNIVLKCRNDEQLRQWLGVIIEEKQSSSINNTKIDLISAPQTPRMEVNNPLLSYDEDEEDYYDDHNNELFNEDDTHPTANLMMRNRSYSYQYNNQYRNGSEVSSRKASLSSASNSNIARHFMNGIPGMTLPPLPRSPTANAANTPIANNNSSDLYSSNLSYPSSPPGSSPSSPTLSTTTTNTSAITVTPSIRSSSHQNSNSINPSGSLWQRRQQSDEFIDDIIEEEEIPLAINCNSNHIRTRSQSSPNITRPTQQQHYTTTPELPTLSNIKRNSNNNTVTVPSTPSPTTPTNNEITKVKVHYFGAIYVVVVPTDIEYEELQKKIESKIKLCGQEFETSLLGLKYEDEDGDLITISSSEDVQMGFESKGPNNAVNLYVTS